MIANDGALRRVAWTTCLALALAAVTTTARANDPVAAQALFDEAKRLMAAGNFAPACVKLEESQRLDPGMGTLFHLADCHQQMGKTASAWAEFLEVAGEAKAAQQADREKIARDRAAALEGKLPRLVVVVAHAAPGLEVKRDGVAVGPAQWGSAIAIDPGEHTISATAPSKKPWQTVVSATADATGTPLTVDVPDLEAAPAAPPRPAADPSATRMEPPPSAPAGGLGTMRTVGIAVAGAGVIGVVVGTIFGLNAKSKLDDSSSHCDGNNHCDQSGVDLRSDSLHAGTISTVAFAFGGLALAGGAALFFLSPNGSTHAAVTPRGVLFEEVW